jgi:hypothetical protein
MEATVGEENVTMQYQCLSLYHRIWRKIRVTAIHLLIIVSAVLIAGGCTSAGADGGHSDPTTAIIWFQAEANYVSTGMHYVYAYFYIDGQQRTAGVLWAW